MQNMGSGDEPAAGASKYDNTKLLQELLLTMIHEQNKDKQKATQMQSLKETFKVMSSKENSTPCADWGVNLCNGLNLVDSSEDGLLASKVQAALAAASAAAKHHNDSDSEGEYDHKKPKKLKSGLNLKIAPKVKFEVEWAHHNLAK